ncbi:MAG: hypothetical protein LBG64_01670 [Pseudomonadales bacterium]|jgi:hypothetical protein|nr:hypothetical protein [Pseudomonadales bacterium]
MSETPRYYPEEVVSQNIEQSPDFESEGDIVDTTKDMLSGLDFENVELSHLLDQTKENYENDNYEEVLDLLNEMVSLIEDDGVEDIFTLIGLISELI